MRAMAVTKSRAIHGATVALLFSLYTEFPNCLAFRTSCRHVSTWKALRRTSTFCTVPLPQRTSPPASPTITARVVRSWATRTNPQHYTGRGILGRISRNSHAQDFGEVSDAEDDGGGVGVARRASLGKAYLTASRLFLVVFLVLLLGPDRTQMSLLATKVGGAAGYGLASAVSHILSVATKDNQLRDEDFRRLNVGLFLFSSISLTSIPGEAAFHPNPLVAVWILVMMTVTKLLGCAVSFRGWGRGVRGWHLSSVVDWSNLERMGRELDSGVRSTWKGLVVKSRNAKVYRNSLLIVLAGIFFHNVPQVFHLLRFGNPTFQVSLGYSAIARLLFVATIIYTLKDGAERDCLAEPTFVKLNILTGSWALAVGMARATTASGFKFRNGFAMMMFSLPFLWRGIDPTRKQKPSELATSTTGTGRTAGTAGAGMMLFLLFRALSRW